MKRGIRFTLVLTVTSLLGFSFGCAKVLVHGKDRPAEPLEKRFSAPPPDAFQGAKKALEMLGYKVQDVDEERMIVKSGWQSTKPNSHYLDLFDRKDYGTTGAYYQLVIQVEEEAGESNVSVAAPVRSVINHITSSHREERKILKKIGDLLRRDDFEMTNVGVKE